MSNKINIYIEANRFGYIKVCFYFQGFNKTNYVNSQGQKYVEVNSYTILTVYF